MAPGNPDNGCNDSSSFSIWVFRMNDTPSRLLLLGANFCGNVGDLFILHAIADFIDRHCKAINVPCPRIDVIPRPLHYDRRIALMNTLSHPQIHLEEPHRVLRRQLDYWMRHRPRLEQLCAKLYFSPAGSWLSSYRQPSQDHTPNGIIVAGGELDVPYTLLDIHHYLRSQPNEPPVCYGPVSLPARPRHIGFLKTRFAEVKEVAVRDPISLSWLQQHAIQNVRLVPDCAFLDYRAPQPRSTTGCIGLCLHSRWGYDSSLNKLVVMLADLLRQRQQTLLVFATNLQEDFRVVSRMQALLKSNPCVEFALPESADKLSELVTRLDLTISDRLHALIVSMLHGTSILPLASRPKIHGYCEYWQLQQTLSGNESAAELAEKLAISQSPSQRHQLQRFCERAHREVSNYYQASLEKMGLVSNALKNGEKNLEYDKNVQKGLLQSDPHYS